jgi:hypothetical protein
VPINRHRRIGEMTGDEYRNPCPSRIGEITSLSAESLALMAKNSLPIDVAAKQLTFCV